jgi:hypothetical protein
MKKIQDRLAEALTARGEREVQSKSKYRQFTRKSGGFYFLGHGGALRTGDCASRSISITDISRDSILNGEADKNRQTELLAKADAEWLAGHPELAETLTGTGGEHLVGYEGFKAGNRDINTCRCDRCRTIRALRRTAEAKPKQMTGFAFVGKDGIISAAGGSMAGQEGQRLDSE